MEELEKAQESITDAQRVLKLTQENAYLRDVVQNYESQLVKLNNANAFKRLDLLFKVLDNSLIFSEDVVNRATKEIVEAFGFNEPEKDGPDNSKE